METLHITLFNENLLIRWPTVFSTRGDTQKLNIGISDRLKFILRSPLRETKILTQRVLCSLEQAARTENKNIRN